MFIREIKKRNKGYSTIYKYHHLVESVRTVGGPRQRFILNLGTLDLPKKDWPLLARRIEEIVKGDNILYAESPEIERLANFYACKIIRKGVKVVEGEEDIREVDVNGVEASVSRTIGGEHIGYSYVRVLELEEYLGSCGFTRRQIEVAILLIISRMISPGSERHTHFWAKNISGLDEIIGTDFSQLSLNTLYEVSDNLYVYKEEIEDFLSRKERSLFNLKETIILFDLTNTYFEGSCKENKKAKFGKSKEKRMDCRLITLGLIIDEEGFPKASKIFEGNQDDPGSLIKIIKELRRISEDKSLCKDSDKITIVMDAGIATEDNLKLVQEEGYHYVCVPRKKPDVVFDKGDLVTIKEDTTNKIEVKIAKEGNGGDTYLYCKSLAKEKKGASIRNKFEELFEEGLKNIEASIHKKGGTKRYQRVCERVGRLRQKYPSASQYYKVEVIRSKKKKGEYASKIDWEYINKERADERFSGSYYLRTDRDDLDEPRIWEIYSTIRRIEDAFRSVKSELGLRPNFHQKGMRVEGHIFISLLAYHITISIQNKLHASGFNRRWKTIRETMSTHVRQTIELPTKNDRVIYVRKCSKPEFHHRYIYDLLQIPHEPIPPLKTEN